MTKFQAIAAICIIGFTASASAQDQWYKAESGASSSTYGNTSYHSDGSTSSTYGNTTYHSNGSTSSTYGNTTYNSNGTSSQRSGNTTYNSDGSSSSTYGNTTMETFDLLRAISKVRSPPSSVRTLEKEI
ncbi:hypothetical protein N9M01_13145 [Luminiphilus sp.]|nr:hypothetical protein [Luminiphilus sp.]